MTAFSTAKFFLNIYENLKSAFRSRWELKALWAYDGKLGQITRGQN